MRTRILRVTERRRRKDEVVTAKGATFCKVHVGSSATNFLGHFLNVSEQGR